MTELFVRKPTRTLVEPLVRLTVANRLLAGLLSNPVVVAHDANYGWCLVNVTDADIAGYAVKLADELIAAQAAMPNVKGEAQTRPERT